MPTLVLCLLLAPLHGATSVQSTTVPLRVSLGCSSGSELTFRITLQNVSAAPTAVVIGAILANDKTYMPGDWRLTVKRPGNPDVELRYVDPSHGAIAGRLDPWLVPLPPGATYSVPLPAHRFVLPPTLVPEPFTQPAQVSFDLKTQEIGDPNLDMQGLRFVHVWVGTLRSNSLNVPAECDTPRTAR